MDQSDCHGHGHHGCYRYCYFFLLLLLLLLLLLFHCYFFTANCQLLLLALSGLIHHIASHRNQPGQDIISTSHQRLHNSLAYSHTRHSAGNANFSTYPVIGNHRRVFYRRARSRTRNRTGNRTRTRTTITMFPCSRCSLVPLERSYVVLLDRYATTTQPHSAIDNANQRSLPLPCPSAFSSTFHAPYTHSLPIQLQIHPFPSPSLVTYPPHRDT